MTIVEFLEDRLAEDEAVARAAADAVGPRWTASEEEFGTYSVWGREARKYQYIGEEQANHSARHDPARVLAECKAKRAILDLSEHGCGDDYERVQQALALPYADHAEYQKAWRP